MNWRRKENAIGDDMATWRSSTTSEGMSVVREGVVVGMNWMNEQGMWMVAEVERR